MNPSNSTEADPGLLPTSSTHPGSRPDLSRPEPMSNDEISDSDVSFDDDDDEEDMHDTSGKIINGILSGHFFLLRRGKGVSGWYS